MRNMHIIGLFFLLGFFSLCLISNASAQGESICDPTVITNAASLASVGFLATVIMIAIGYMIGRMTANPKIILWSKTEGVQIIVSIIIATALLFIISTFCVTTVYDTMKLLGQEGYAIRANDTGLIPKDSNIYAGAEAYLNWTGNYAHHVLGLVRYTMGVIEIRVTHSRWECEWFCLFGGPGTSSSPKAGEYTIQGALSILLNSSSIYLLTVLFQKYTLQYIQTGLFIILLPLGIILRSVPFMRGFGGSLIALVVVMYIFYPLLLVFNAMIWPPVVEALDITDSELMPITQDRYRLLSNVGLSPTHHCNPTHNVFEAEKDLEGLRWMPWITDLDSCGYLEKDSDTDKTDIPALFMLNVAAFIGAIFLPALNFIIIIALTRETSRMIGEEMDVSRLARMV